MEKEVKLETNLTSLNEQHRDDARKRAKQCSFVKRNIDEYYPETVLSPKRSL